MIKITRDSFPQRCLAHYLELEYFLRQNKDRDEFTLLEIFDDVNPDSAFLGLKLISLFSDYHYHSGMVSFHLKYRDNERLRNYIETRGQYHTHY